MTQGFVPPPYPYDRLDKFKPLAQMHVGGLVDLSIGTPCDDPPAEVIRALSNSQSERGYPPSIGSDELRNAIQAWIYRKFEVSVPTSQIAACIGSKEFVATTPQYLRLAFPTRDTVLFPAVSYPTYEMGAILAGCRPVSVPMTPQGGLDLAKIDPQDISRALMIWSNSPNNPTGALEDLSALAVWGRENKVPVFSDECYTEFTWDRQPESILQHGLDGVIALHSLSKRSNLAGVRVGFYAGDKELVNYLKEVRKHVGMLVPGPAQAAAVVALNDDHHVALQRDRYRKRLELLATSLTRWSGFSIGLPAGGFYLWFDAGDGWEFAQTLARCGGTLVSPGDFYGAGGANNVRVAAVQPDERIELVAERLTAAQNQYR